ncbi:MAG: PhoH family protein [Acidimicrobiia bacterium]|nr:PhoH family protein [Acidimicrobiia bacterium]
MGVTGDILCDSSKSSSRFPLSDYQVRVRVPSAELVPTVVGQHDSHLRVVELAYPSVKIVARGNEFLLAGPDAEVTLVRTVLEEVVRVAEMGQSMSGEQVQRVVDMVASGEPSPSSVMATGIQVARGRIVRAKTAGQRRYVEALAAHTLTFGIGPAGTGKTYLAVAAAVAALNAGEVRRILLSRPAVEAGERLGFLPGDLAAKIDPYLRPLYDALFDMLGPETTAALIEKGTIEIAPLAFMRGRTLNDAFVILDEAQNTSPEQMKMFLTRLGFNSRMVITGDVTQTDLPIEKKSGLRLSEEILAGIDDVGFVRLTGKDVVRARIVADIVRAYERYESKEGRK